MGWGICRYETLWRGAEVCFVPKCPFADDGDLVILVIQHGAPYKRVVVWNFHGLLTPQRRRARVGAKGIHACPRAALSRQQGVTALSACERATTLCVHVAAGTRKVGVGEMPAPGGRRATPRGHGRAGSVSGSVHEGGRARAPNACPQRVVPPGVGKDWQGCEESGREEGG